MIVPSQLNDLLKALRAAGTHTFTCAPAPMQRAIAEVYFIFGTCNMLLYGVYKIQMLDVTVFSTFYILGIKGTRFFGKLPVLYKIRSSTCWDVLCQVFKVPLH